MATTIHPRNHPEFDVTDIQEPVLAIYRLLYADTDLNEYFHNIYIATMEDSLNTLVYTTPALFVFDNTLGMEIGVGLTYSSELTINIAIALPLSTGPGQLEDDLDNPGEVIEGNQLLLSRIATHIIKLILAAPIKDGSGRLLLDSLKSIGSISSGLIISGQERKILSFVFDQLRISPNLVFKGS